MIYQQLYARSKVKKPVSYALIGAGDYGTELIVQSMKQPLLRAAAIADINIELARRAYRLSGIPEENITVCDSRKSALQAIETRKYIITEDAMLLMDLPIDVIAEGTGETEPGTRFAYEAIRHGKHVAMINKETDTAVGPIMRYLANKAGVVYTPVDGDQPGLLMGLMGWAESLGFKIISGGKFRDYECGFDVVEQKVTFGLCQKDHQKEVPVSKDDMWVMDVMDYDRMGEYLQKRRDILSSIPESVHAPFDVSESQVMANTMGLKPDIPELHNPILRYSELASVLCLKEDGGILENTGVVDCVTPIIDRGGVTAGGGVFIVVSCDDDFAGKGLGMSPMSNRKGTATAFFRPYHLCGQETHTSILCAALLGIPTGGDDYKPRYDIVRKAAVDLKAGYIMGNDHDHDIETVMLPACKMADGAPIPGHIAEGHKLLRDVPKGTTITYGMVEAPADSLLWSLRKQQDEMFMT